jgi:hypothetical protein
MSMSTNAAVPTVAAEQPPAEKGGELPGPAPPPAPGPPGRAPAFLGEARSDRLLAAEDSRTLAQQDRDRILYTNEFRRLAAVTQVASATEGRIFHNLFWFSLIWKSARSS